MAWYQVLEDTTSNTIQGKRRSKAYWTRFIMDWCRTDRIVQNFGARQRLDGQTDIPVCYY